MKFNLLSDFHSFCYNREDYMIYIQQHQIRVITNVTYLCTIINYLYTLPRMGDEHNLSSYRINLSFFFPQQIKRKWEVLVIMFTESIFKRAFWEKVLRVLWENITWYGPRELVVMLAKTLSGGTGMVSTVAESMTSYHNNPGSDVRRVISAVSPYFNQ